MIKYPALWCPHEKVSIDITKHIKNPKKYAKRAQIMLF